MDLNDQELLNRPRGKALDYRLGLIDYGMGNLHSVQNAFNSLGKNLLIVKESRDLKDCDALVLPGVGSFDPAMENLNRTGLIPDIKYWVRNGKPLLGICLGLQLLFESSQEGTLNGLGLIKGHVEKLPHNQNERIPHMGWAPLQIQNECPLLQRKNQNEWMYFVHSYAAIPIESSELAATTKFGEEALTAIVWKETFGACQFHPEKSSKAGRKMLNRWINWLNNGARPTL